MSKATDAAKDSHRTVFVLATIFLDAIAFGVIVPVLPRLIMDIGHINVSAAIAFSGWMTLGFAGSQFVSAPILGNLSDGLGRRPVLLIALGGLALSFVVMAVAQSLALLFAARLLAGVVGGSYSSARAALADITAPEDRARSFGYVGAAFGIGFVVGPAIGGLLGELGSRAPFYAAAALAGLNFFYGLFVFPETLLAGNRRAFDWRRANPLGAWRAMRELPGMTGAALVMLLWQIASLVYPLTWNFYGIARFGWSNATIGISLAAVGVVMALCQIVLTGRMVARYAERGAATIGIIGATCGFAGYAIIDQSWMAFALMPFIGLQSLVQPSLTAILSRRANATNQGEVQGIIAMAMGLGTLAAPLLFNPVMARFSAPDAPVHFAGAAFAVAAVFGLLTLLALRALPRAERGAAET